jgi:hypothetical protein
MDRNNNDETDGTKVEKAKRDLAGQIAEAVKGIEDVITGKIRGLDEAEFRRALE